jgi:Protein of unknown function (DUF2628)
MTKPDLRDPDQWIPRDLFADYCGPGSDKLLAYYDKAKAKRQMIVSNFEWFAFLLLPAWLGYRQQWVLWGTLTGCFAALSLLEAFFHFQLPNGAFGGLMIALGLMAHGFLLTNANGLYLKLKQQDLSHDAVRAALLGRARPRAGMACLALVGSLLIGILGAMFSLREYP